MITQLISSELAAALMWVSATIILLVPAAIITIQILSCQKVQLPERSLLEISGIRVGPLPSSKTEAGIATTIKAKPSVTMSH